VSGDLTYLAYRQEILAEDIEEVPGALWKPALIDRLRVSEIPQEALPLLRIVVGIDPSGSSTNEAGIVAAAKGKNGHGYVLADRSLLAPTPRAWAQEAVRLYHTLSADRIVAERNFWGDMVREV
jgi:phage terminase large subunit-like protein